MQWQKLWEKYRYGGALLTSSLILAMGVRTFMIESFYIPSGSMEPTLRVGDKLLISKFSFLGSAPDRGSLIVFRAPDAAKVCNSNLPLLNNRFIKRVIAVGGDTVEIRQGVVFINQLKIEEPYLNRFKVEYSRPLEIIPQHYLFVLGDNRTLSCDSHVWGLLPQSNVIGKVFLRYAPVYGWF